MPRFVVLDEGGLHGLVSACAEAIERMVADLSAHAARLRSVNGPAVAAELANEARLAIRAWLDDGTARAAAINTLLESSILCLLSVSVALSVLRWAIVRTSARALVRAHEATLHHKLD